MSIFSTHVRGFLITLAGALILTPDTLLIRLINTDVWTMIFWRGMLLTISIGLLLTGIYKGRTLHIVFSIGQAGLLIALFHMIGTICFTTAVIHTTVAKTLIIMATAPMFASLFSWLLLKEPVYRATWLAMIVTFIGICIVVSDHSGQTRGSPEGDVAALIAAIATGMTFTLIRRSKHLNMIPAMATGWFLSAVVVWPMASPLSLSGPQIPLMLLLGLVVLPLSFSLVSIGPRYIPAAEVGLLMLLEVVLGPLWVWLVIHEVPSVTTVIGGILIICTITVYSIWRLWHGNPVPKR